MYYINTIYTCIYIYIYIYIRSHFGSRNTFPVFLELRRHLGGILSRSAYQHFCCTKHIPYLSPCSCHRWSIFIIIFFLASVGRRSSLLFFSSTSSCSSFRALSAGDLEGRRAPRIRASPTSSSVLELPAIYPSLKTGKDRARHAVEFFCVCFLPTREYRNSRRHLP